GAPPTLQFTIAPATPSLVAIQLANETPSGFTIQVTGYSTTRILKTWSVQFTPASGYTMPVSQFTINIQSTATLWFASAASQTYGGQFTLSVPFSFQSSESAGQNLLQSLASISVTMSNDVGASSAVAASTP